MCVCSEELNDCFILIFRYLAPRPATYFRNRLCIDGGLTLFMPPTSASETVCVHFLLDLAMVITRVISFFRFNGRNMCAILYLHLSM
jgi:hypothetical protein